MRQLCHLDMLSIKLSQVRLILFTRTHERGKSDESFVSDLAGNETLNREAAELSGLPEGDNFTMANFSYANSVVLSQMLHHLENTMFLGISVSKFYT